MNSRERKAPPSVDNRSKKANRSFDSDEGPPPVETNDDKLLWRQDPDESHSDWTIEISYNKAEEGGNVNRKTDKYHVHKANLSAGPRKSEFFARLFDRCGRFTGWGSTTRIDDLNEIAAGAFPQLLDYIYSVDADLEISTLSATALYHLGGYLEIRRLRWEAKQFWLVDMDCATCGTYYEHAKILDVHVENIKEKALEKCSENIMEVDETSRLVHVPGKDFWIRLVETRASENAITRDFSLYVSKLLEAYFTNCATTKETFKTLTDARYLPFVHRNVAIKMMDLERQIVEPTSEQLTDLQQRCVRAIADDWLSFDEIQQSDFVLLQQQSPLLLTTALCTFAKAAKNGARCTGIEITVEGAGHAAVNGKYSFDIFVGDSCARYKKVGRLDNRECRFYIYRWPSGNDTDRWFISALPDGETKLGTNADIDFYHSGEKSDGDRNCPPSGGWRQMGKGLAPPPTIIYECDSL